LHELPQLLDFCITRNITLYFNVVFTPFELSLKELSLSALKEVVSFLKEKELPNLNVNSQSPVDLSIRAYTDFIQLLNGWIEEKIESERLFLGDAENEVEVVWSLDEIRIVIAKLISFEDSGFTEEQRELQSKLAAIFAKTPKGEIANSLYCYIEVSNLHLGISENKESLHKLEHLSSLIEDHIYRENILRMASQAPPLIFADLIAKNQLEDLRTIFAAQFEVRT
jgi:hypothetical protein